MSTRFFVKMAAAIALSVFAFAACDEDSKGPKDPNYNEDGGNGKPAETEAVTPGLSVSAAYLGDYFKNGYNDYVLVFTIGETDKDGYFVNGGSKLSLDILTSNGGPTLFPEGVYTITNANHNSAGILPSPEADAEEPLTFYYFEQDKDNHWKLPLEAAKLDVKVSGAQYTIKVDFSSDGDDFSWLYKGTLSIENNSGSGGDDEEVEGPDGDYDFKADLAYASNLGRSWDDPDDPNDTDDWELQFYNSNDEEEWMSVEIVAPAASNISELPTGNFVIPADFDDVDFPAAGSLLPPYYWSGGYYGTFYAIGEEIWYYADSGSLKISKSGDNYTFELSFRDNGSEELGYAAATVTMTYTGKVIVDVDDYWDGSEDEEEDSMLMMKKAAPSTKMKMVRRNTAKRQSKAELKAAAIR